jgi:hypothetical protein
MRVQDFIVRTGIFVPVTISGVALFFMVFGIIATIFHFESVLFSELYSKSALSIFGLATLLVISYQVYACCKKNPDACKGG